MRCEPLAAPARQRASTWHGNPPTRQAKSPLHRPHAARWTGSQARAFSTPREGRAGLTLLPCGPSANDPLRRVPASAGGAKDRFASFTRSFSRAPGPPGSRRQRRRDGARPSHRPHPCPQIHRMPRPALHQLDHAAGAEEGRGQTRPIAHRLSPALRRPVEAVGRTGRPAAPRRRRRHRCAAPKGRLPQGAGSSPEGPRPRIVQDLEGEPLRRHHGRGLGEEAAAAADE